MYWLAVVALVATRVQPLQLNRLGSVASSLAAAGRSWSSGPHPIWVRRWSWRQFWPGAAGIATGDCWGCAGGVTVPGG